MKQKVMEKESKEDIVKAFRLFDDDKSGSITFTHLKRVAKELGESLTDEELKVCKDTVDNSIKSQEQVLVSIPGIYDIH
jgi:Ca2+-binding protein (EF-Hand superfamily)